MQLDISQLGLLKLQVKSIFRRTHLISLSFILLLSSAVFTPLIACTLCADSITLSYLPGVDLLFSILLIYIFGRCISSFVGTRKIYWKWNALIFLIFIVLCIFYVSCVACLCLCRSVYFVFCYDEVRCSLCHCSGTIQIKSNQPKQ